MALKILRTVAIVVAFAVAYVALLVWNGWREETEHP